MNENKLALVLVWCDEHQRMESPAERRMEQAMTPVVPISFYEDWMDFTDRVAKPLVDAVEFDDDEVLAAALERWQSVSPYYLAVSLVMAAAAVRRAR